MRLNETIARLRAAHLMVRDAKEWDELSMNLWAAYDANDEELIEQLRSPFLQSWRTVTRYVLRDTFDAAGITVGEPTHPWGIATLSAKGASCEPLLCRTEGFQLLTFAEILSSYSDSLEPLFTAAGQADR
ncbi:hypothetical protein AB4Y87_22975 [Paenarthrobacter sp. RAF54_2]|uniref:hypothetical protein n=1 Tax=Paenarthrobacter sp. RAF54_2 TaxID=3233061 RepID=UPI003F9BAEFD